MSNRTIWKWDLDRDWPADGVPLVNPVVRSVAMQDGKACIWIEHAPDDYETPKTLVMVKVVGTGKKMIPDTGEYVGMFIDGPYVGHVYVKMTPLP